MSGFNANLLLAGINNSPWLSTDELQAPAQLAMKQQRNALLNRMDEQTLRDKDIQYAARASAGLLSLNDEAKMVELYPSVVAEGQKQGYLMNAPAVFPGVDRLRQIAALDVPTEKQQELSSNAATMRALTAGAPVPGVATPPPTDGTTATTPAPTTGVLPPTPELTPVVAPGGAKFSVAAPHAPRFQALVNDLEAAGYKINPDQSGGYNRRFIAGTQTPSNHAHGSAIDINWTANARGTAGDIPPELARSLAAKHGLVWGGDWTGTTRDPMHFEVPGTGRTQVASATPTVATDGTVAAPAVTAPPATSGPALVRGTEFTADQAHQLAVLGAARGTKPSDYLAMQERFRTANRAEAAAARSETQQAAQMQLSREAAARDAKRLELEIASKKREGLPTGYKLDDTGKAVRIDGLPPDPAVLEAQAKIEANAKTKFDQANALRDEATKITETFRPIQEAYERVGEAAAAGNALGDLALIYTYTRLLDPATVHEEEIQRGMKAGGLGEYVSGWYNRVAKGEALTPAVRQQFLEMSRKFYDVRKKGYDQELGKYRALAQKFGLDPDTVGVSLARDHTTNPSGASTSAPPLEQRKVGTVYPTPKGPMKWTGTGWLPAGE